MTPASIPGLKIPEEQLQELLDALAEAAEPKYELPGEPRAQPAEPAASLRAA